MEENSALLIPWTKPPAKRFKVAEDIVADPEALEGVGRGGGVVEVIVDDQERSGGSVDVASGNVDGDLARERVLVLAAQRRVFTAEDAAGVGGHRELEAAAGRLKAKLTAGLTPTNAAP